MEFFFDDTKFTALFADLLRPMTEEERALLKESIQEDGIKTPILIDETNGIIDGINRLSIAAELDLHPIEVPIKVMAGLSMEEKRRVALSLNTARRHLTREEVKEARERRIHRVAELRAEGKSLRAIAEEVGVSHPQVIKDLKESDSIGNQLPITPPSRITTSDGRTYPAKRERPAPVPTSDDPPPLPETEALEYPDQDDDTEPSQFEDDIADDDEPDTRAPICEGCGEPDVYCHCGDQADELIDGSKFTYDVSLGKWVPRAEAIEAPPSEEVRQLRSERTAQREAARLASLERRAAEAPVSAEWEIRLGDCVEGLNHFCHERREAGTVRLVFADPPFNIGWDYGDGAQADSLEGDRFVAWCGLWMDLARDTLTADGSFWLLIGDEFAAELKVAAEGVGFHLRQWLIWYEAFGVNCSGKFNRTHRHLFHFVVDPENFVFNANAPEIRRPSDRQEKYNDPRASAEGKLWDSVWGIKPAIPRVCGTHAEAVPGSPAPQLPLALLRPIIACASEPADLVLDPFCGNATTGVAALQLGRRFLGFEKRQPIFDLATLRLKATVADLARKEI